MIIRGSAVAAVLLTVSTLAACGSSGGEGASASGGPVEPVSFQVRPVLTEVAAESGDCTAVATAAPAAKKKLGPVCSADRTVVYTLGPAAITETNVESVTDVDAGSADDQRMAAVDLDTAGTAAFASLTAAASRQSATPRNQFAIVVDGAVVSAPAVMDGAITGGQLQVIFSEPGALEAFVRGWPAGSVTSESVDAG